mmetsp:Transcript_6584/g.20747  ORF Transcript_6584/g.20747 Transcript_6584/m.20747 type:complete len:272 (+) Transcript_6584:913-1728(+)
MVPFLGAARDRLTAARSSAESTHRPKRCAPGVAHPFLPTPTILAFICLMPRILWSTRIVASWNVVVTARAAAAVARRRPSIVFAPRESGDASRRRGSNGVRFGRARGRSQAAWSALCSAVLSKEDLPCRATAAAAARRESPPRAEIAATPTLWETAQTARPDPQPATQAPVVHRPRQADSGARDQSRRPQRSLCHASLDTNRTLARDASGPADQCADRTRHSWEQRSQFWARAALRALCGARVSTPSSASSTKPSRKIRPASRPEWTSASW